MDDIFDSRDSAMYSLLRRDSVRRLLSEHRSGAHDHHKILFSLVVFEQWLRGQASPAAHAPDERVPAVLNQAS
jgi:asparagine synthase (glutamine-hydrolysing)